MIVSAVVSILALLWTSAIAGFLGFWTLNFVEEKFITNY